MTLLVDKVTVVGRVKTAEGYLRASARIARTGIQEYRGLKDADGRVRDVVKVYRPPEEVFNEDSMKSFAMKPVTNDHPDDVVDSTNARQHMVGMSGENVTRDGDHLFTTLLITHADAIKAVEGGKEEISNGYTANLDWTSGTTPEGEAYDAIQREIRGNHIAIVDAGRCGGSCRIHDSKASCSCGGHEVTDNLKTIKVGGLPVQVTDAAETVIVKLQDDLRKANEDLVTAQTALKDAKTEHATALSGKQGEIDALNARLTDEAIDARVADRLAVITKAKLILGDSFDPKGKSNDAIRKEAVTKILGADKVIGKDAAYFTVAFDVLDAKPATDPVREHYRHKATDAGDINPYQAYVDSLRNAHKADTTGQED